jgi:hypothetical protein
VVAVEVHPAADQTPPAARGHVKCPAEPLASHCSILSRQSPDPRVPRPPMTVIVPQLPRGSNPPASHPWPSLTMRRAPELWREVPVLASGTGRGISTPGQMLG